MCFQMHAIPKSIRCTQSEWKFIRSLSTSRIIRAMWNHLVSQKRELQYDFIVKVDDDSYVRPSTFRKMFSRYDPSIPYVLSMGGKYGLEGEDGEGSGPGSEGYFVGLSREAIR